MSFNAALTSGQLQSLRGTSVIAPSHSGRLYVSTCTNTVIYTARINQSSFATSFAQVTYDGGSGTLADVLVGHTIFVSHTNDIYAAFFVGRIRKTPGAATLYINETSAPFADNDYVFIVDDFRVWDKLGRFTSNVLYPDYDVTFRELLPRIFNLQAGYVVMTDGSDGEFEFAPGVSATTTAAVITDYLWDVADGTITVGSDTDKDITVTFPPGFRWIHLTVTDNGGLETTRHIPVWVHDPDNMPAPLEIGDLEVTAAIEDGFSGSIPAFSGVSTLLDNTLLIAWMDAEYYNGTAAHIDTNVVLQGRFRQQRDATTYDDAGQQDGTVRYDIEGPLQILARLQMSSVEILSDNTPTAFCEIATCTPWREIFLVLSEFSTFHEVYSLSFDDTSDTFADLGVVVPQGSLLNAINSIAECTNSRIQSNPAGMVEVVRASYMVSSAARDALVTVADWTTADILGIEYGHDSVNVVGRVLGSGGSFNSTSRKLTVTNSIAPGLAQDYPDGAASLDRQVLASNALKVAAAAELNARSGHAFAHAQGQDELTIVHPDGYWWLTPSANQWYTFTLDGSELVSGLTLDDTVRWLLASTSVMHNLIDGTREVRATYQRETSGAPGQTINYPPQNATPITVPEFPPLPDFPAFEIPDFYLPDLPDNPPPILAGTLIAAAKHDGNTVMVWAPTGVWVCSDFLTQLTPTWIEITPPLGEGETITACKFLPGATPGAYVLTSGVDWEEVFDFTISQDGWDVQEISGDDYGLWTAGSGFRSAYVVSGLGADEQQCRISIPTVVGLFSRVTIEYDWQTGTTTNPITDPAAEPLLELYSNGDISGSPIEHFHPSDGTNQSVTFANHAPFAGLGIVAIASLRFPGNGTDSLGYALIKRVIVAGEGSNPFTGAPPALGVGNLWYKSAVFDNVAEWVSNPTPIAGSQVLRTGETQEDVYLYDAGSADAYYSDDRGVTWSSAINVGTPPDSAGGFDTQKVGTVSLGAADAKVRRASTQGGAYSDYTTYPTDAIPTAIFIPRYKLATPNTENGPVEDEPDYITGSDTSDTAAGHSLWTVTSGGGSVTQIEPINGGFHGLATGPNCLHIPWYKTAYQDIFAVLGFGGTRKLAVSVDLGANWVVTGALDATANFVTSRKTDIARKQLFLTNGTNCAYCSDYKSDPLILATRIGPSTSALLGIDVLP